ncbi:DNA alkylation repair protein [Fodinibius salsisoli]|uniref:DNA alkylation repair protein n=1 Tax=Fodinibius salsisoli TaxID=2820877 RepID=A0ABT3PI98_9BACT|nr:DNA alkylation repair protein [Fodinibius salsisoli]MCW9705642.1 DNA alkylation repair protein [Fodinibius salsisoli]
MAYKKPTDYFDEALAQLLAEKLKPLYPDFDDSAFVNSIKAGCIDKRLKERVALIAEQLHRFLPDDYQASTEILTNILGPENKKGTGMFSEFYWVMPIASYVEQYGLDHFQTSMDLIEEVTKRNTGEYAIRPFIRKYPEQTLLQMNKWAQANNFHLRRLASEGLRPKLPWATKLDLFIDQPKPVFDILTLLQADPVRYVQKSVANHITDYLKVNRSAAQQLISDWESSENQHTKWILKYAQRKL